jgi:hypothetical protein
MFTELIARWKKTGAFQNATARRKARLPQRHATVTAGAAVAVPARLVSEGHMFLSQTVTCLTQTSHMHVFLIILLFGEYLFRLQVHKWLAGSAYSSGHAVGAGPGEKSTLIKKKT